MIWNLYIIKLFFFYFSDIATNREKVTSIIYKKIQYILPFIQHWQSLGPVWAQFNKTSECKQNISKVN